MPAEIGNLESRHPQSRNGDENPTRPLAVLIVGQTGAGKTRTAPPIKQAMRTCRGSEPAHFIADVYKTYHPAYRLLVAKKPALASPATGPDARRWLGMASAYAAERRMDVLLELACRYPTDFVELVRVFREADYRVEVAILAVPEGLSRLGILTRFSEAEAESDGASSGRGVLPPRLTPKRVHDESYSGLVSAAKFVHEEEGVVDQVVVVRRGGGVVYANERVVGASRPGWVNKGLGTVVDVIVKERASKLSRDEGEMAKVDILKLKDRNVAGLGAELAEIETLLQPLM